MANNEQETRTKRIDLFLNVLFTKEEQKALVQKSNSEISSTIEDAVFKKAKQLGISEQVLRSPVKGFGVTIHTDGKTLTPKSAKGIDLVVKDLRETLFKNNKDVKKDEEKSKLVNQKNDKKLGEEKKEIGLYFHFNTNEILDVVKDPNKSPQEKFMFVRGRVMNQLRMQGFSLEEMREIPQKINIVGADVHTSIFNASGKFMSDCIAEFYTAYFSNFKTEKELKIMREEIRDDFLKAVGVSKEFRDSLKSNMESERDITETEEFKEIFTEKLTTLTKSAAEKQKQIKNEITANQEKENSLREKYTRTLNIDQKVDEYVIKKCIAKREVKKQEKATGKYSFNAIEAKIKKAQLEQESLNANLKNLKIELIEATKRYGKQSEEVVNLESKIGTTAKLIDLKQQIIAQYKNLLEIVKNNGENSPEANQIKKEIIDLSKQLRPNQGKQYNKNNPDVKTPKQQRIDEFDKDYEEIAEDIRYIDEVFNKGTDNYSIEELKDILESFPDTMQKLEALIKKGQVGSIYSKHENQIWNLHNFNRKLNHYHVRLKNIIGAAEVFTTMPENYYENKETNKNLTIDSIQELINEAIKEFDQFIEEYNDNPGKFTSKQIEEKIERISGNLTNYISFCREFCEIHKNSPITNKVFGFIRQSKEKIKEIMKFKTDYESIKQNAIDETRKTISNKEEPKKEENKMINPETPNNQKQSSQVQQRE